MYINRKTGELVEAEFNLAKDFWVVGWEENGEYVYTKHLSDADFQEQYGEAMICPVDKRGCGLLCKGEHCGIHSKLIDCGITCEDKKYPCIPYIPEEQKEGFKPIITTGQPFTITRGQKPKEEVTPSLLLSDEEIRNILQTGGTPMDFSRAIAEAELRHLEELGIMYVKVIQERSVADGAGFKRMRKTIIYIPLSEYRKENEK